MFKRKIEDLTGKIFGKRKVLKRIKAPEHLKNKNQAYWEVECECGNLSYSTAGQLRNGARTSCRDCCMKKFRKKEGESSFNGLYLRYKHGALIRKIDFNLSKDQFKSLVSSNCHYCNQEPQNIAKLKNSFGQFVYNGVDRVNTKDGYHSANCVSCCEVCNRAKSDMSYLDFIKWLEQLTSWRNK